MVRAFFSTLCLGFAAFAGAVASGTVTPSAAEPTNPALRLALAGSNIEEPAGVAPSGFSVFGVSAATLSWRASPSPRLSPDATLARPFDVAAEDGAPPMGVEVAFSAPSDRTGLGVDLAIAPRARFDLGAEGARLRSAGAEVRLGQGLGSIVRPFKSPTWDNPTWYFFAATDGQALTWKPEALEGPVYQRGLRFQEERVVIGDSQLGMSFEANGMQASLSYIQREVSSPRGSADENFLGASITVRR